MPSDPSVCRGKSGKGRPNRHYWDSHRPVRVGGGLYVGPCSRCASKVTVQQKDTAPFDTPVLLTDPVLIAKVKELLFNQL